MYISYVIHAIRYKRNTNTCSTHITYDECRSFYMIEYLHNVIIIIEIINKTIN